MRPGTHFLSALLIAAVVILGTYATSPKHSDSPSTWDPVSCPPGAIPSMTTCTDASTGDFVEPVRGSSAYVVGPPCPEGDPPFGTWMPRADGTGCIDLTTARPVDAPDAPAPLIRECRQRCPQWY